MRPKLWNGPNAMGEGLVRGLELTDSPFLSAHTADGVYAGVMDGKGEVKFGDACVFQMENGFLTPGGFTVAPEDAALAEPTSVGDAPSTDTAYMSLRTVFPANAGNSTKLRITPSRFTGAFRGFSSAVPDSQPVDYDLAKYGQLSPKNLCALFSPPQKYTGLMRRWVAAMYGRSLSWGTRVGFGPTLDGLGISVFRGDIALDVGLQLYSAPNIATGIFKSQTGRYWLIFISDAWVNYTELRLTKCGKRLQRYKDRKVAAGKLSVEQGALIDSYILSELYPSAWQDGAIPWSTAGTFSTEGTSWVYGWKFNSAGSEASLVTQEVTGTGPGTRLVSRRYRADISEVLVGDVYQVEVAVSQQEESAPWASTRVRLWTPTLSGMIAEYLGVSGLDTAVSGAPLLCAYDDDDVLQITRWTKTDGAAASETIVTKTASGSGPSGFPSAWMDAPYGVGPTGYGEFTERRDDILVGDGATHTLGGVSGTDVVRNEETLHSISYTAGVRNFFREVSTEDGNADQWGTWFGFNPSHASIPYPSGDRWLVYHELPVANSTERWSTLSRTSAPQFVLAIPRDNASSWYEGSYTPEYVGTMQAGGFYADRVCFGNTIYYHEEKFVGTTEHTIAGPNVPTGTLPAFDTVVDPVTTIDVVADLVVRGSRFSVAATESSDLFDSMVDQTDFVLMVRESLHNELSFVSFEDSVEEANDWPAGNSMAIGWQ